MMVRQRLTGLEFLRPRASSSSLAPSMRKCSLCELDGSGRGDQRPARLRRGPARIAHLARHGRGRKFSDRDDEGSKDEENQKPQQANDKKRHQRGKTRRKAPRRTKRSSPRTTPPIPRPKPKRRPPAIAQRTSRNSADARDASEPWRPRQSGQKEPRGPDYRTFTARFNVGGGRGTVAAQLLPRQAAPTSAGHRRPPRQSPATASAARNRTAPGNSTSRKECSTPRVCRALSSTRSSRFCLQSANATPTSATRW